MLSVFVLSTAINFLDRLTLATVGPRIRDEFQLSGAQYGIIVSAFQITYAVSAPFAGIWIDRIGLNRAISLAVGLWSCVGIATGFTRGLDFAGDLAFVGLSQVRESAVFSGIPITERLAPEQRTCGVCVVDLRRGETIALLKFESGVQEVFAVAVLPRRFPDLINDDEKLLESSFVVPTECLGEVAATVRASRPA